MYRGVRDLRPRSDSPALRGLLGWWCCLPGRCGGSVLADLLGRFPASTVNGPSCQASTPRPGALAAAMNYNGTNQYADIPGFNAQIGGLSQLTMACWVYRSAAGISSLPFGRALANANEGIAVRWDTSNQLRGYVSPAAGSAYFQAVRTDTGWHHVAIVFDASQGVTNNKILGYLDGVKLTPLVSGTPPATTVVDTTNVARIGRFGSAAVYNQGPLDDLAIWNRALTDAEVFAWYQASLMGHRKTLRPRLEGSGYKPGAVLSAAATFAGTGTMAATATRVQKAAAAFSGTGSLDVSVGSTPSFLRRNPRFLGRRGR